MGTCLRSVRERPFSWEISASRRRWALLMSSCQVRSPKWMASAIICSSWLWFLRTETLRNDLYLTLSRGEFERGSKSAAKNIEVRVSVIDRGGRRLEVSFHFCSSLGDSHPSMIDFSLISELYQRWSRYFQHLLLQFIPLLPQQYPKMERNSAGEYSLHVGNWNPN